MPPPTADLSGTGTSGDIFVPLVPNVPLRSAVGGSAVGTSVLYFFAKIRFNGDKGLKGRLPDQSTVGLHPFFRV